jgi:hypothetical protein
MAPLGKNQTEADDAVALFVYFLSLEGSSKIRGARAGQDAPRSPERLGA